MTAHFLLTDSKKLSDAAAAGRDFFSFPTVPTSSITEEFFGTLGPMSREQGWCVFPQERAGRRMPAVVDRVRLKPSLYHDALPSQEMVDHWAAQHFSTNVALTLGPVSGNVWALDIDVTDLQLALKIQYCAFRVLGETPFRRIGNRPKQALFYRAVDADSMPANRSFKLAGETGGASDHAIEILSTRKTITVYGRHHQTLKSFTWADYGQPAILPPTEVPVVTQEQLDEFVVAVQRIRPFHVPVSTTARRTFIPGASVDLVPSDVVAPIRMRRFDKPGWTKDASGLIVDGREDFLYDVVRIATRQNAGACLTEAGQLNLAVAVEEFFRSHASADQWEGRLVREIADKVFRRSRDIAEGRVDLGSRSGVQVAKVADDGLVGDAAVLAKKRWWTTHGDDAARPTAWLDAVRYSENGLVQNFYGLQLKGTSLPEIPDHLRIPETADGNQRSVGEGVEWQLADFMTKALENLAIAELENDPEAGIRAKPSTPVARLIDAAAGGGKTTRSLSALLRCTSPEEPLQALFLVPRYALAEQIIEDAITVGFDPAKVMLWVGRERSAEYEGGCHRPQDIRRLQASGRSGADVCSKTIKDENGDEEEIVCPFFETCLFQRNRRAAAGMDLVVAVHQYATVPIPGELKASRIVVIDESIRGQIQREMKLTPDVLIQGRDLAFLSEKEKSENLDRETVSANRQLAGHLVLDAMLAGRDPAKEFVGPANAEHKVWLEHALAVCARRLDSEPVTPKTISSWIEHLCSNVRQTELMQEHRLWRLIEERVELLEYDRVHGELASAAGVAYAPKVLQPTDCRIRLYKGDDGKAKEIVLSWMGSYNFTDTPLLMLDASADLGLLEACLNRPIEHDPIAAFARVRTVLVNGPSLSKSSILPRKGDSKEKKIERTQLLIDIRTAITAICAHHPGGVMVCAVMKVVDRILDGWCQPGNATFVYFGNTTGLNFARGYDAAVMIGCLNPSAEQIDAGAAPYIYNAEKAEPAISPSGPYAADKLPDLFTKRDVEIQLRNGSRIVMEQRVCADGCAVAQRVYDQVREQQHKQATARLRFIFRPDIPTVYNVGAYIPADVVVDELVSFGDLVAFGRPFEISRGDGLGIQHTLKVETEPCLADENALHDKISATPALNRVAVHLETEVGLSFYPAFNLHVAERKADQGFGEIVFRPDMTPIIRPAGWIYDHEVIRRFDDETQRMEWLQPNIHRLTDATGWQRHDDWTYTHLAKPSLVVDWRFLTVFEKPVIDMMMADDAEFGPPPVDDGPPIPF